jgi:hypothetical protein
VLVLQQIQQKKDDFFVVAAKLSWEIAEFPANENCNCLTGGQIVRIIPELIAGSARRVAVTNASLTTDQIKQRSSFFDTVRLLPADDGRSCETAA